MTTFDPTLGTLIGPAWAAIHANLQTRDWASEEVTISIAQQASGIHRKTAKNLISSLAKERCISRRKAPSGKHFQLHLNDCVPPCPHCVGTHSIATVSRVPSPLGDPVAKASPGHTPKTTTVSRTPGPTQKEPNR